MLWEKCSKSNFKLEYERPDDFTVCIWQRGQRVIPIWIAYRVGIVIIFGSGLITAFSFPEQHIHWYRIVFLSSFWCGTSQFASLIVALVAVIIRYSEQRKNPASPPLEKMPVLFKILWVMCNLSSSVYLVVSAVFWLVAYTPELYQNVPRNVLLHVCLPVIIIADFSLHAFPYRFLHFYMPILFCISYIPFTMISQTSGVFGLNAPIYTILDWRTPGPAILTCTIQLVSVLLAHCALCLLCMLKSWVKKIDPEPEPVPAAETHTNEPAKIMEPKPIQSRQSRLSRQSRPIFRSEDSI